MMCGLIFFPIKILKIVSYIYIIFINKKQWLLQKIVYNLIQSSTIKRIIKPEEPILLEPENCIYYAARKDTPPNHPR